MLNQITEFFIDSYLDISEWFKYDFLKRPLPAKPEMDLNLHFKINKEAKGGYWVTSDKYPSFIASGDTYDELRESIFQNLLLYFNVPRPVARRLPDLLSLHLEDGTIVEPKQPSYSIKVAISS